MDKPVSPDKDQGFYLKQGEYEFIAIPSDGVVCLTICPMGLQDNDHRSISVMSVEDTETGKRVYEFSVPVYDEAELGLWASAYSAAITAMAFLYGKESNRIDKED